MRREQMSRDDGMVRFHAEDGAAGYLVLLAACLGAVGGLVWLWPGPLTDLWQPWQREQWSHPEALAYGVLVAIVAAAVIVVGGYLSDRRRRHIIEFDGDRARVQIQEWWRGLKVEAQFPFSVFSGFECRQPVGQSRWWELGVMLETGSYWRLDRSRDAEALTETCERLNREMDFEGTVSVEDLRWPDRIERSEADGATRWSWRRHERPVTRLLIAAATVLLAVACSLPLFLVYEQAPGPLAAAFVMGVVAFGAPLFFEARSRAAWPFLGAWTVVMIVAVVAVDANWFYLPLATVGAAIFGKSALAVIIGLWRPEEQWIEIGAGHTIEENGQPLEREGRVVTIDDLEGAVADVRQIRPAKMLLVGPGGKALHRARNLGEKPPEELQEQEPLELEMQGLSLFELVCLSVAVDLEIQR